MENKELAIRCPGCDSRIVVDVRTQKVLTWSRAGEVDAEGRPKVSEKDWDGAMRKASGRLEAGLSKFDEGLAREKKRGKDLDELWKKLGKQPDEEDGEAASDSR